MNLMLEKREVVRNEPWRRELSQRPCRRCGREGCQAAHLGHSSIGKKAGDDQCVALCPDCHREMDTAREGKEKWWVSQVVIPEERARYLEWQRTVEDA